MSRTSTTSPLKCQHSYVPSVCTAIFMLIQFTLEWIETKVIENVKGTFSVSAISKRLLIDNIQNNIIISVNYICDQHIGTVRKNGKY